MAPKAPGFKSFKDWVILLLGAVAKGDFKRKPLMVHRAQNPRAFRGKTLNLMSVHWRWDKKAWMASEVFLGSFHNCFLEAERYLHGKNLAFTVLLILDNAPVHCCWELKNAYPDIEVVLMPPNMASLIQALNQDMIKAFQL